MSVAPFFRSISSFFLLATVCASNLFGSPSKPVPTHIQALFQDLPPQDLSEIYTGLKSYKFYDYTSPTEVLLYLAQKKKFFSYAKQIASKENFHVSLDASAISRKKFESYFKEGGIFQTVSTLSMPGIAPEFIRLLPRTVKNLTLSCAPMENCFRINDDVVSTITEHFFSLESLNLSFNQISGKGAEELAKRFKALKFLRLKDNPIGAAGAKAIAENLTNLTGLDLGGCRIGDEGAIALSSGELRSLQRLLIFDNGIGPVGGQAILDALSLGTSRRLSSLRSLVIRPRNFGLDAEILNELSRMLPGGLF